MEPVAQRHLTELPGLTPKRRVSHPRTARDEVALRLLPDGTTETIPLTREILLNPSEEVHVPQNDPHSGELYKLTQRLKRSVERRPGCRLFSDLMIQWPGERTVSPDITIAEKIRDPQGIEGTLDVAREKCRVLAVIEVVTTTSKNQREKDEEDNPPLFARQGVKYFVLLYPSQYRADTDVPIIVKTLRGSTYVSQSADARGRFLLSSLGVRLSVRMQGGREELIAEDAKTGKLLTTVEEEEVLHKAEAKRRRQAERRAKSEAEARQQAERQAETETEARQQAERQAETETEARQQAERQIESAVQTMANAVLALLETRGLDVDEIARRKILDCRDPRELERWLGQAITVDTVDKLFCCDDA